MANDKIVTKRGIYLYINGKEITNDIKSIRGEMKRLQNDQAKMTVGSEQYIRTGEKIKALDRILQKHRSEWRSTTAEVDKTKNSILSLGKITDAFNKYFGMITTFLAGITGLTFAIRKCVDDFADLEESEADARKYTGMTRDGIKDLNEEFKKMDTRTARTELNAFASDAGRLGLKTKQEILDFVETANIIKIALGKDLGEDAVKNIGKLSDLFGITDEKGLKGGMLATASAINELAQNSSASEPYLLNFTARLAGTGNQAKISMTQIMGYASVLDQDMQQVEMSSTALQKVILKMYKEPADFARIAGKDVTEFTRLLKEDANEAFLQFLSGLNDPEGMIKLAPILEELKLEGSRASGVLGNLATSVDRIRVEQEIASKAFEEGTSAINEYNIKNNTLQATIEKAKKKFKEISYELGEKLAPYMGKLISQTSTLIKILSVLTDFFIRHGAAIIKLTTIYLSYVAAKKVLYVWSQRENIITAVSIALKTSYRIVLSALAVVYNLLRGRIFAAQVAMIAFNNAAKANPVGLLVSALTSLGMVIANYISKQKEANKFTREMTKEILQEEQAAGKLFNALKLAGSGTDERKRLIDEINELYGDYIPFLLTEESSLNDIKEAQEAVNTALRTNIALKTQNEAVEQIENDALEKKAKVMDKVRGQLAKLNISNSERIIQRIVTDVDFNMSTGFNKRQNYETMWRTLTRDFFGNDVKKLPKGFTGQLEKYIDLVYDTARNISKEKAKYEPFINPVPDQTTGPEVVVTANRIYKTETESQELDDKELRKVLQKGTEALENEYAKRSAEIKNQYITRKITESQMQEQLFDEELFFLFSKKTLYEKYGQNVAQIEESISDKIIAETKRREKEAKKNKIVPSDEEEEKNPLWKELAKGVEIQLAMNESLYAKGLISHQEYTHRKAKLDEQYRKEKKAKDKKAAEEEMRVREAVLGAVSSFANTAATFISIALSKEEQAIENKYKRRLELAEGDTEATAAIEEEKEAELLAIRKKYADKSFAMQVLSITAETAVAAMRAYSAALELGFAGIPLAPIMAAAAIAAGMAQIASANQQREQAAQMWDGGYVGNGGKYEPKKLIQTHGGEFVATKETVQLLRPMFDVIDYAQRTGNVAPLKGPEMAQAIGSAVVPTRTGSASMPAANQHQASSGSDVNTILRENMAIMAMLKARLDEPIISETYIDGKRGVKKNLADYDKLIKNATRR